MGLLQTLVPMEKWKRDALVEMLRSWLELTESALACRSGLSAASGLAREMAASRTAREASAAIRSLQKALDYGPGNVSPAAVCGWLEWALR